MPVERAAGGTSLAELLDRVLDKGIVVDASVGVSPVGIALGTVDARVVVASIDTYLQYAEAVSQVSTVSSPALEPSPEPLSILAPLRRRRRIARTSRAPVRSPRRKRLL